MRFVVYVAKLNSCLLEGQRYHNTLGRSECISCISLLAFSFFGVSFNFDERSYKFFWKKQMAYKWSPNQELTVRILELRQKQSRAVS